jgi:hypothetical protein
MFEIAPDALIRVQVRGITRQTFQVNTLRTALGQELSNRWAMMSRQTVPDNQELARDVSQQMLQELDHPCTVEGFLLGLHVQRSLRRDSTDDREMIPSQRHSQNGCLSDGCVSAGHCRQQIEARLIHKHYGAPFLDGFFCSDVHVSTRHCSIAASLRWLARSMGFWLLHRIPLSIRPTCTGVYDTPNSRLMTAPTRLRVHTSPRNPKCSAPRSSSSGIRANWSALSRASRFLRGGVYSASTPPTSARLTHWLTAPWLTPSASAMSFCFQPLLFNSQARKRRFSRQSPDLGFPCFSIRPVYPFWPKMFSYSCSNQ